MRRDEMGSVYFLRCGESGPIKIGHTKGLVSRRVNYYQQCAPDELTWIGAYIAPFAEERRVHEKFVEHRRRAEWFEPADEIFAYIECRCPDFSQEKYLERYFRIGLQRQIRELINYRREDDWRDRFTASCAIDTYVFHKWLDGAALLTIEQMDRIEGTYHQILSEIEEVAA